MLLPLLSTLLSLSAIGLAALALLQSRSTNPAQEAEDQGRLIELDLLDERFEAVWAELEKKANSRAARKPKDAEAAVSEGN